MAKTIQRSFTSGELSNPVAARADLAKFASGLSLCENMFIRPHGGAYSRAGFKYVCQLGDSTKKGRLIPFSFNTEQTYMLLFEEGVMRVIKDGALVTKTPTTITAATVAANCQITSVAHGLAIGDKVFISSVAGMTQLNNIEHTVASVIDANNVTLTTDSSTFDAYVSGGSLGLIYELTTPYVEADLQDLKYTQSADILTITHVNYDTANIGRLAHDSWTYTPIQFASTLTPPTGLATVAVGSGGSSYTKTYYYVVTAIDGNGVESLQSATVSITLNSLSSTYGVKLTWTAVAGAVSYKVYKDMSSNTNQFGWIGDSQTTEFTDFNIAPDSSNAPPKDNLPFTGVNNKPAVSTYYKQRQIFANTWNNPQTWYATQIGIYNSLRYSSPARATDAIEYSMVSGQVNEIRHLIAIDSLVMMTSGGEWMTTEGVNEVFQPDTVGMKAQSYNGSAKVSPVVVDNSIVYVQEKGSRFRDMSRESSLDNYGGKDLSILAEHLTEGYTIDYLAFSQEPYSIAWAIRNDGVMLGLTYKKEHDVWGWHHHVTNGLFECVASVSEGNRDVPYVITSRNIGGNTVRFVERMEAREETAPEDCFYVDCGLSYNGASTTVISGLNHLNGGLVSVLSDGNEVTGLTVQGGKITLPSAATKVHVGLGYTARMTSLPIESGQNVITGASKAVSDVSVLVENSRGAMIGMESLGDDGMVEIKSRRESDSYNTLALYTGFYKLAVYPDWDELSKVSIKQSSPLPLAVLTIVPEVDVGD